MPATRVWLGTATPVAQVTTLTPGGTIEATDLFTVTINGKTLSVAAGGTTVAAVCGAIVAAWPTWPEFAEVTAANSTTHVTLTAATAGVPFTVTVDTTEAGGGAADDQTFVAATTTASSGPNSFSNVLNWSGGVAPTDGDTVVYENSAVDCTDDLDQSAITLAALEVRPTYTGSIGRPRTNANGYAEYREQYLKVGATLLSIDSGGPLVKINTGAVQTTAHVLGSGSSAEANVPAVLFLGTHASNAIYCDKGTLGIAFFAGEVATVANLEIGYLTQIDSDATVTCGVGATLTTIEKIGGTLIVQSNVTTLSQRDGETTIRETAAVTTLNVDGGTVYYESSGTCTTAAVRGELNFQRDSRARTVTNASLYAGGTIMDPGKTVTWTNGIDLPHCAQPHVAMDLGSNITITPSAI